ncbi:serine hydrolase [Bradyrhizobium sp. U87765 SZCCT0131]|uniref:D-alanyl-D-alanine carboxypeptidase n=1 Tax=unclassified Bradyrhizobium TaxID=2631580 RepID=UPI001BA85809|nr:MULTISPECIES: D-alanyl-D-alanine carboxypeptidase [unclassified Bradyrhizobium]MBR1223243.1 serine hydrolase [Bradyrhizobium sp. U87765 SZCCT0131]MBR1265787.1 serine hydrolase [Bradyrhizobium sp. U87765 SZCCT0134]MBR1309242.1 serine hydrolase [Bradyrhizobium sp. U87765 SZCCT0110]MBR1323179.1 serine hydrolase [Bradyrhizobium sp. U87765 SZCCT0109]MBR1352468.1 serine hydrolase [Bradyrhizobium sp. U87765 SZCCT0048]
MIGATSASARALRFCIFGLATISAAIVFTTDTADARRRHHHSHHRGRHVVRVSSSYSPPFSSIIVDGNSGNVLQANNPDSPRHPASLTKIMTLYLLFEKLESGKMSLDSEMDVSAHAASQAPTKLGLRPGQSIRVEDAIKGLVTRSANDAAVVIAEAIGGDEDDFATLMTRKARSLGMSRTTYKNASGLPDDDQITTARDQATLGRAIQDRFPRYYRFFATNDFHYRGSVIRNHNHLLGRVEGVDGIKTGYTRASGFNLVTSMRRGNRHLVGVVLGGRSGGSRDAIMRNLLAENLDRGATRRTVAAITERNPADYKVASADDAADAAPESKPAPRAAVAPSAIPPVQVQGAIQTAAQDADDAARTPMPMPAPNKVAAVQPAPTPVPAKPTPAPLTSGVISQPLPIVPGSAEPMTPVRVKTVQIKSGQTRVASAAPSQVAAPAATASIPPARADVAETSNSVVAKVAELPPQNPKYGTGQGILGVLPASALQQHSQTMAYADPARAAPAPVTAAAPAAQPAPSSSRARSGWIIQVGALQSETEAKQRLDAARSAATVLGKADPFTEEVSKGGKSFYRARFAGLDKDSAETACRTLKRNEISCIAIRN